MSHRRNIPQSTAPAPARPIMVVWAQPVVERGQCPKCGERIGRAVRAHAVHCDGKRATD